MKKLPAKQILDIAPPKKKRTKVVMAPADDKFVTKKTLKKLTNNVKKTKKQPLRNHPFVVPVVTFVTLFFVSLAGFVTLNGQTIGASDSHVVRVSIDGKSQMVPTRAKTVKEFLDRAEVKVDKGDVVEPAADSTIDEDDFRINVYKARPVTIIDGDKRLYAVSAAKTPRSVATQAGLTVYPEDNIESSHPSEQILKDQVIGEKIIVDRATPTHLNLYGTPVTVRTRAKSVGDLLKEKQVSLGPGDSVQPSVDTLLTPEAQVFVVRSGTQIATSEESIPMPIETVEDPSLSFGASAVRQRGTDGKKIVTYQVELKNGREVGRTKIQEVVATAPVKQIVARGKAYSVPDDKSSLLTSAGIALSDYPYVNYIIGRESGWCATKWQGQAGYCPGYYSELHSPTSGYGYGLCQATPAGKMASAGADWASNPVTQLKWCSGYANGRYGSWEGAYNAWQRQGWW